MATYVFPTIVQCVIMTTTFDLWMLRSGYDIFALVINFINLSWVPCHIVIGLFETPNIFCAAFAKKVKVLLAEFNLTNKIIAYVKDEGSTLNSLKTTFTFVVSCEPLQLAQPFASVYFGHVTSKVCQYATNEAKVGVGMKEVSLKNAQVALQKTIITWTKKFSKARLEWEKAYHEANMQHKKLKTRVKTCFASKVILFQKTLEYANVINIYYTQQNLALQARVLNGLTWAITRIVIETLNLVFHQCLLN
jgi:hypothetical protein